MKYGWVLLGALGLANLILHFTRGELFTWQWMYGAHFGITFGWVLHSDWFTTAPEPGAGDSE